MNQLMAAFLGVTRFRGSVFSEKTVFPGWQLVLARSAWGLVQALAACLVLWLAPNQRITAALFALVAVCLIRYFVFDSRELRILVSLSELLAPSWGKDDSQGKSLFQQALFNLLLLARPVCIFCLLANGNAFWLVLSAGLGMTVMRTYVNGSEKELPRIWLAGSGVALVVGIVLARCCGRHPAMLLAAVLALAVCWILPSLVKKLQIPQDKETLLYFGEAIALAVGVLGQAL